MSKELDVWIAENIFGWKRVPKRWGVTTPGLWQRPNGSFAEDYQIPCYDAGLNSAEPVLEWIRENSTFVELMLWTDEEGDRGCEISVALPGKPGKESLAAAYDTDTATIICQAARKLKERLEEEADV